MKTLDINPLFVGCAEWVQDGENTIRTYVHSDDDGTWIIIRVYGADGTLIRKSVVYKNCLFVEEEGSVKCYPAGPETMVI